MTYSIVARDPDTGELGVAVQSHWFSVGPIVPWARPGIGAVATQANAEVAYGPRALDLLERGMSAPGALKRLLAEDPLAASRQVAIVDARGEVAAHTGEACMAFAGDVQGPSVSCQANIMATAEVWPAMLEAYTAAPGRLSSRLLTALNVAEATGGDLRGRQSAAILVVPAAGEPWDTVTALRVEDHPDPLVELTRLAKLDEAYRIAGAGRRGAGGGPPRRGLGAVHPRLRARAGIRRAALLGRSGRRAGGGHGHRAGPRARRDRGSRRLARAAATAHP